MRLVYELVSHQAEGFAKRLKAHVMKFYPKVEFNVAFKAPNEFGKFFTYKDGIRNAEKKSRVIYQINWAKENGVESEEDDN